MISFIASVSSRNCFWHVIIPIGREYGVWVGGSMNLGMVGMGVCLSGSDIQ